MLDIYDVKADVSNVQTVNEIMNKVITDLSLKAVMPTEDVIYYYCDVPEDGGVSSFCILDNGHITMHTFPFFSACYVDIMFDSFDCDKAKSLFSQSLKTDNINSWYFDRDSEKCNAGYDDTNSFGPHALVKANCKQNLTMGNIYGILETLPEKIGMHPITRPFVVTNRISNYDVISGVIIIAESHISFHYNVNSGDVYFDIYSCKFCNPEDLYSSVSEIFGTDFSYQLISRGMRHKKALKKGFSLTNNGWRENI